MQHLSLSGTSQLLLTWFWCNFIGSFLGASRTDSKYQVNICPGSISSWDICPYQEYLSSYWLNFDQTLNVGSWDNLGGSTIWKGKIRKETAVFEKIVEGKVLILLAFWRPNMCLTLSYNTVLVKRSGGMSPRLNFLS